jgi:DNA-binding SARP family transcriptional activator
VEFRVLGPVDALVGGQPVALGRRRERCLLALLLLEPGVLVPVPRLIDLLWGEELPDRPRKTLQVHVSRLRAALAAAASDAPASVVGGAAGYAIEVDPHQVDAHRFTGLVAQARDCDEPATRAGTLRTALALWRGPALVDVLDEPVRWQVCAGLEEARLAALELRVEADLAAGRHGALVPELADLTARHPDRERLVAARMLALYRAGLRQDALAVYRETTRMLADEFGLEPTPALRALHAEILADAPALVAPRTPVRTWTPPTPAQLPRDLPVFAGRTAELAALTAPGDVATVVITAVHGMAGVGKTALVVHAAHRLAARCPDGQVYLDLHGHTEGVATVSPADALDRLLRTLGVPGERVPPGVEERAALYRTLLADRKMVVLLDNAVDEEQVEPLLPAAPGCVVLITSRHRLVGLDQVRSVSLEVLPADEAVTLLVAAAGRERLAGESVEALTEIVSLCGHLPLAIQIAAARLRANPSWSVRQIADLLAEEPRRLGELAVGRRSVHTAIAQSYRALADGWRRLFRLLGLHPGTDIDVYAAGALAAMPVADTTAALAGLVDAHLVGAPAPGRFQFHDLVRAFARAATTDEDDTTARDEALARLVDHYVETATTATDLLYPYDAGTWPTERPGSGVPVPPLPDSAAAAAWLDTERPTLVAVARLAAERGWVARLRHLSHVLFRFLWARSHLADAYTLHELTCRAAEADGDKDALAWGLCGLANVESRRGGHAEAVGHFTAAVDLFRELGDDGGLARTFNGLGRAHSELGAHEEAVADFTAALALHERSGNRTGEARTHANLGNVHRRLGNLTEARRHCHAALTLFDATGNPGGRATTLNTLGEICQELGEHEAALGHHRQAADLHRELADANSEAMALANLGAVCRRLGQPDQAADHFKRAAELYRLTDDEEGAAAALTALTALR